MKSPIFFLTVLNTILCAAFPVVAQTIEPTKLWEVGDKATYTWTLFSKSSQVEEEVISVSDTEIKMVERMGEKNFDRIYDINQKGLTKYPCLNSMVQCTFTPANRWADWPLEIGKKWSNPSHVQGPTFEADLTKEHVVEAYEKVKVPAGEFDAYRIYFTGKVKGKDNQGRSFSASEKGTYWYGLIKGKPNMIKFVYQNTAPEKVVRELISVEYK
jgi:hypothetical protein